MSFFLSCRNKPTPKQKGNLPVSHTLEKGHRHVVQHEPPSPRTTLKRGQPGSWSPVFFDQGLWEQRALCWDAASSTQVGPGAAEEKSHQWQGTAL